MLKLNNNKKLIATTPTSSIYLLENKGQVLKVLNERGLKDELPGLYFLKACSGISECVELFDYDSDSMLIEFLPGKNLYQFSKSGNEEEASKVFVKIIKEIHIPSNELDKEIRDNLVPYSNLFRVLERIQFPYELDPFRLKSIKLTKSLLASQREEVLLHGDLHHENVKSREDGSFACYDPKGYYGDPAYELGTTLKNPWDYPLISHSKESLMKRADYFSKELEIPLQRILDFTMVHVCMSIAWAIEDGGNYDHQESVLTTLLNV